MTRMSLFLLPVVVFVSCTINDPELPEWETQWRVELTGDSVRLGDILSRDAVQTAYNTQAGDSIFTLHFSDTSDVQQVDAAMLTVKLDDQYFSEQLGVFEVEQPAAKNTPPQSFSEVFAEYDPQVGSVFPPLPARVLTPDPRYVDFTEFEEIHIASATLSIIFHNDLFLDIDSGMTVTLIDRLRKDDADGGLIDSLTFNAPVPAGESLQSSVIDLGGKILSNQLELLYKIPLVGTDSARVLTQADLDGSVYTEVILSPLSVNRALAKVPAQQIVRGNTAPVAMDDFAIRGATIDEGGFSLALTNKMNVDGAFEVTLNDFVNNADDPLIVSADVPAGQKVTLPVNLDGYTLQNGARAGATIDSIHYDVRFTTVEPQQAVWVTAEDSLSVAVVMDSIRFNSFNGQMAPQTITIDPIVKEDVLDIRNLEGRFVFPDVVLTINIHNQIDLDTELDLKITGYHTKNSTVTDSITIHVNRNLERGNQSFNTEVITFDKSSSQPSIVDLMSILPNTIKIKGAVTVGGEGVIHAGDVFYVDYSLDTPLSLRMVQPVAFINTARRLPEETLSPRQRRDINDHFTELGLSLNTRNALPIGAQLKFYLSGDSSLVFDATADSTQRAVLSVTLDPAQTNANGYVNGITRQELNVKLTRDILQLIQQDKLFYGSEIILTTDGDVARFKTSDMLWFTPVLNFTVHMKR
ncbi:MAG: hypothetical protein D6677_07420 [Calditrichaeota bacterium]|nr:MAG: hypothetical protein D6677_07420 [Calditrichota bacterium]